jgi:hypothetical protein
MAREQSLEALPFRGTCKNKRFDSVFSRVFKKKSKLSLKYTSHSEISQKMLGSGFFRARDSLLHRKMFF